MAYERRSFAGGAVSTTITSGIDGSDTSITIASATGWPTGSAGDFFVVLDRGTATEEKVRIASRTSTTLSVDVSGRGVDGTSGVAHSSGASIEVCLTATDLDEANAHLADTGLDHHTQYLNNARHDIEGRHTFGAALGTPATPAAIGTANATGSGDNPAREDHVHEIGTGAIDTSAMFAAGVVDTAALAAASVTEAKMAASAWTSYSPTLGGWTIGDGTVSAAYAKVGRTVHYRCTITAGSTTAFTGDLTISTPFAAAAEMWVQGGVANDADGSGYSGAPLVLHLDTSTITPYYTAYVNIVSDSLVLWATTRSLKDDSNPWDWATGDVVQIHLTYEATS